MADMGILRWYCFCRNAAIISVFWPLLGTQVASASHCQDSMPEKHLQRCPSLAAPIPACWRTAAGKVKFGIALTMKEMP
jgi:hypothetical protein